MQQLLVTVLLALCLSIPIQARADEPIVLDLEYEEQLIVQLMFQTLFYNRTPYTEAALLDINVAMQSGRIQERKIVNFNNPVNEWLHLTYELYNTDIEHEFRVAILVTRCPPWGLIHLELGTRDQWLHKERKVLRVKANPKQIRVGDPAIECFQRGSRVFILYTIQ